jgi:hypothetical protein
MGRLGDEKYPNIAGRLHVVYSMPIVAAALRGRLGGLRRRMSYTDDPAASGAGFEFGFRRNDA